MKNVSFSVNLYDQDGDNYGDCILIHINSDIILRFHNMKEYDQFIDSLQTVRDEIAELVL